MKEWTVIGTDGTYITGFKTQIGAEVYLKLKKKETSKDNRCVEYKIIEVKVANRGSRKSGCIY